MANKKLTEKTKHIAFMNKKGGVGKTALNVLVAEELMRRGYKVLLIDCDAQHNLSDHFRKGSNPEIGTTSNLMIDDFTCEECVQHTVNGDVIVSDWSLANVAAGMTLAGKSESTQRNYQMREMLKSVEGKYDFIFFDNNTSSDVMAESVLSNVDYILVPTTCKDGITVSDEFFSYAHKVTVYANPSVRILGYVLNCFDERQLLDKAVAELAEIYTVKYKDKNAKTNKTPFRTREGFVDQMIMFNTRIRHTTACESALAAGELVYEYDGEKNDTYKDIKAFTNELLEAIKKTPNGLDLVVKKAKVGM